MLIKQVVQVQILGAPRTYTYKWEFDPFVEERQSLAIGDKVEIPPNQVQEEGASATVVALGSSYDGPMKEIVRVIKRAGIDWDKVGDVTGLTADRYDRDDEDLWGGWPHG